MIKLIKKPIFKFIKGTPYAKVKLKWFIVIGKKWNKKMEALANQIINNNIKEYRQTECMFCSGCRRFIEKNYFNNNNICLRCEKIQNSEGFKW